MTSIRYKVEAMLGDYNCKFSLSRELIERRPDLDDGRVKYWLGKVEVCQEVLVLLDNEATRLARIIQKELGGL